VSYESEQVRLPDGQIVWFEGQTVNVRKTVLDGHKRMVPAPDAAPDKSKRSRLTSWLRK